MNNSIMILINTTDISVINSENISDIEKEEKIKQLNTRAKNIMNEIKKIDKNIQTLTHSQGTNVITYITSEKGKQFLDILEKIEKIENVTDYLRFVNHSKETYDAIDSHDYFKAYSLGCSMLEYYGKKILETYLDKNKTEISNDKLGHLNLETVMVLLYTHKVIKHGIYSDMIKIAQLRNSLIHSFSDTLLNRKFNRKFKEVIENASKIKKCMLELENLSKLI